jgi:hypothetical protein
MAFPIFVTAAARRLRSLNSPRKKRFKLKSAARKKTRKRTNQSR